MDDQIVLGSKVNEDVTCSNCHKVVLASEAHCYAGKNNEDIYMCPECKATIDEALAYESNNINYTGAVLLGLLAGVAAGFLWFLIVITVKMTIGYMAIGVGALVGYAVMWGSGKRRGVPLQIISAVITVLSIIVASYFSTLYFINDYITTTYSVGSDYSYIFISPFDPDFLKAMISPIGVLIWVIGITFAYRIPKARKI